MFFIMACAALRMSGLSRIISALFFIISVSTPMDFILAASSGDMFAIWFSISLVSSSVMDLTWSAVNCNCSGVNVSPMAGTVGSATKAGADSERTFFLVAAIVLRASSITSSSNNSQTSSHTRSNPARSTIEAPLLPYSQHSSNSRLDRSNSRSPESTAIGGRDRKAARVIPPAGAVERYWAVRNMVSTTAGSCELPNGPFLGVGAAGSTSAS
mmetsp:Transcript_447/g.481  ORF Transcript_447/g.481 Transcript_447/m.481 type:complete len:213 (+) Transcript_447:276-914(+)